MNNLRNLNSHKGLPATSWICLLLGSRSNIFFSFVLCMFLAIVTFQNFYSSKVIKSNNVESAQIALCWVLWVSSLRFTLASLPRHSSYLSVILKHNYSIDKFWTRPKSTVVNVALLQANILFDYLKMSILSLNLDSFFFNYQN